MREYKIYIIQKDVAYDFYGTEEKLFQLFKENFFAKGKLKEITDKQIQYIIEKIPVNQLEQAIFRSLNGVKGYNKKHQQHFLRIPNMNSNAGLYVNDREITLFADGTYDAEARFYEILREFHPFFIALEFTEKRYGWLKPLKFIETV